MHFNIFSPNTCIEVISKRHVCVHGTMCDVISYLHIPGIIFHPVNGSREKNIPQCGLGLLRICRRNSRQEEVALTNALIWKRAASNPLHPPSHLAGDSAVALVSIRIH